MKSDRAVCVRHIVLAGNVHVCVSCTAVAERQFSAVAEEFSTGRSLTPPHSFPFSGRRPLLQH